MNKYRSKSLFHKGSGENNTKSQNFFSQSELDYHNRGVLLPFDIEKLLNEFLEDSYLSNFTNVLVIVGKGKVVKPLVSNLLKKHKYVESYKTAGYFNGQEGAFEIVLKA